MSMPATFANGVNVVRDCGARGDGVKDDTIAIAEAIALGASWRVQVHFPPGIYLVTDTIVPPEILSYDLRGVSSARGCNSWPETFAAVTIKFRPTDPTKWLIRSSQVGPGSPYSVGPFTIANLRFDLGDANGLQFGCLDPNGDGIPDLVEDHPVFSPLQSYVMNVRIDGCAFASTQANRASRDGIMTRSGRIQLAWTKCFESVVSNCSFSGGDTQVLCWGCDTPTFVHTRSQLGHVPFAMHGSGTFGARYTLRDVQVEGWTFTPVSSHGCALVLESGSFEQNDYKPPGSGRYPLGTVEVTRNQPTLICFRPMEGILFPGLSLIEVQSGGQRIPAMVTHVKGPQVTVDNVTVFPWTDPKAVVTRIHGYGPLHHSHADGMVSDCAGNAALGCPMYVWVQGRGSMHIKAGGTMGERGDNRSLIVGNRPYQQTYLNGHMSFTGCSPVICAPPEHPLAVVSGLSEDYGFNATQPNVGAPLGNLDAAWATVNRRWALTPKRSRSYVNVAGLNCIPFVEVPGEPNTAQRIWCWQIGTPSTSQGLLCSDPTLPSHPDTKLRIRFRGRATRPDIVTPLKWRAIAAVWEPIGPIQILPFPPRWTTHEVTMTTPAVWQDARRTESVGFLIEAEGVYLAGVTIEEI